MSTVLITKRGAIADGVTPNHKVINELILELSESGGGRVVVPCGVFLAGTIRLRSNVTLHLEEGAVLLGSTNLADYESRVWGHHEDITPWHFILAEDEQHIALTGRGTIRGNGPFFWDHPRRDEWSFFIARKLERPSPMLEIVRCRHVLIEGIRIEGSPGWTLHGHDCDHLRIGGITIRNTNFGPNVDGIDLTGCQDAIIHGCDIDTGDDAIALKTSEYSRACERIAISDCILRTSCVGIRIGFESREDFRDIVITNIVIPRCTRVFDLRAIEGCTIERIRFSNIAAVTDGGWPATRAIELVQRDLPNAFKDGLPPQHPDYGKEKPVNRPSRIRDISFTGLDITTDGRIHIIGKPELPIEGIRFSDLRLRYPVLDDFRPFREAQSFGFLRGVSGDTRAANAAFVLHHVRDLEIEGLRLRWPTYPVTANWRMFESLNARISSYWNGNQEKIRAGELRAPYHLVWARDAEAIVSGRQLHASEPGLPALDTDASSRIVLRDSAT